MDKKSFILYTSFYEPIKSLTNEEKGALLDAIFRYAMGEDFEQWPQGRVSMAFEFIKGSMKRDQEHYQEVCRKRAEAGRRGGAPSGNTNASKQLQAKQAKQANVCFDKQNKQMQAKQADNDNDNDNDIIISSTKVDVSDLGSDAAVTPQDVVRAWNGLTGGIWGTLQSISTSSTRWKMARARILSEGWEQFVTTIAKAKQSEYLTSGNAAWFCFDWFIKPNNYVKVRDGNYMNTSKNNNNGKRTTDTQRRRGAALDIAGFTEEDYSEPL